MYLPEFQPNIKVEIKNSYISPHELDTAIEERKFDEIFRALGHLKPKGECYSDLQSQIELLNQNESQGAQNVLKEGFNRIKKGETNEIYKYENYAVKISSVENIGVETSLSEFASEDQNLKYFIREINTNKIILASYLMENNKLSNLSFMYEVCAEQSESELIPRRVDYKIFMFMPLFGYSLRDVFGTKREEFKNELMDIRWKKRLLDGVFLGIYWIHHNGYAHRDIKPSNILLNKDGIPFISDFGFAKMVDNFRR